MATEDLTTFTEVDTSSYLTVTTSRVTGTLLPLQAPASTRVYKDYGVGHFNALSLQFTGQETARSTSAGAFDMVSFTGNDITSGFNNFQSSDFGIGINDDAASGTAQRVFAMRGPFTEYDTWDDTSLNVIYYFTVLREADAATVNILVYSDSARTNLLTTLSLSGFSSISWRYFQALNHSFQPVVKTHDIYFENFDFAPSAATPPSTASKLGGSQYPFGFRNWR